MSKCTPPNVVDKYKAAIEAGHGTVDLADIQGGLIKSIQARAGIDQQTVDDYAAQMTGSRGRGNAAAEFPYIRIWQIGDELHLASGSHRWRAAKAAGKAAIGAEFKTGTYLEALVDAVSANSWHGLRPTRADIRHSLTLLFEHSQYRKASNNSLAKLVGCSPTTVGTVREELKADDAGKRVGADGREQNTKRIGKKAKLPKAPLSKLDSEPDDEAPLCCACEVREAVDGERCQQCIDADRQPEGDEGGEPAYADHLVAPKGDEGGDTSSEIETQMRAWNTRIETAAKRLEGVVEVITPLVEGVERRRLSNGTLQRARNVLAGATKLADILRVEKGYKTCPKCDGAGCTFCIERGFVNMVTFRSLEAIE